jgi:hypothetical protein
MALILVVFVLETRTVAATGTRAANRPLAERNLPKGIPSKVFREDKTKGWDLVITLNALTGGRPGGPKRAICHIGILFPCGSWAPCLTACVGSPFVTRSQSTALDNASEEDTIGVRLTNTEFTPTGQGEYVDLLPPSKYQVLAGSKIKTLAGSAHRAQSARHSYVSLWHSGLVPERPDRKGVHRCIPHVR